MTNVDNYYNMAINSFFVIILKIVFVGLMLILIRVTVPRIKIESLTKLGWLLVLGLLMLSSTVFLLTFWLSIIWLKVYFLFLN